MADDLNFILAMLDDPADATRLSGARALEETLRAELDRGRPEWGPLVERLLPALIRGIGDSHKGVQVHSANLLQFLAYQSEAVIPSLRQAMAGSDQRRAWGAAIVFARMGIWVPEVGTALADAMGAPDRDIRWAAATFALKLGRKHPEAVAMARESLHSPEPLARKMAAYCLGAMGEFAPVEADLAASLSDPERDVRRAVILALGKLPGVSGPVARQVASLRSDPDPFVRRTAEVVADKMGL